MSAPPHPDDVLLELIILRTLLARLQSVFNIPGCEDRDERSAYDAAGHEQHASGDEYHARDTAHQVAARHHLLHQNGHGDGGDPEKIHDARHEQERHERPAATEAVKAVAQTHHERPGAALAPAGHE